jgi:predicted LPLAT superfamily acyltransferase
MGKNRYVVHFEQLGVNQANVFPIGLKSQRRDAIELSIKQYAARLEHYCRIAPYNWYNFYDVWKK